MAMKTISPGESTRCPPGSLLLEWTVTGDALLVEVVIEPSSAPGLPAAGVQRTGPRRCQLSRLDESMNIVVRSRSGSPLPNGFLVSVRLLVRVGPNDAGTFTLETADVSGTARAHVGTVVPGGGYWQISAPATNLPAARRHLSTDHTPTPETELPDDGLPELAQRAAYAARRVALSRHLPTGQTVRLQIALDRSASMSCRLVDGTVQSLFEVLLGVNQVIGTFKDVRLWEVASPPLPLKVDLSPASVQDVVSREFAAKASTAGTALAPLIAAVDGEDPSCVVVITDGVPADLGAVNSALQAKTTPTRFHLLAIARSVDDPRVMAEPWRDELSALRSVSADPSLTVSGVTPQTGLGWLAHRLDTDDALEKLVADLAVWPDSNNKN
jgi:hypothetical protein